MKLFIGLDFSTTSCALCFDQNGKKSYLSIINRWEFTVAKEFNKEEFLKQHPLLIELSKIKNLKFDLIDRKPLSMPDGTANRKGKKMGKDPLSEWHRTHHTQTTDWSKAVFNATMNFVKENYHKDIEMAQKDIEMCIEFYNMGKTSNNPYSVAEFTYPLKKLLLDGLIHIDQFHVISPPEVKMLAGNGNYKKYQMLEKFVEEDCDDDFFNFVCKNKGLILKQTSKDPVPVKPFDDIIDSYWICKALKQKFPQ